MSVPVRLLGFALAIAVLFVGAAIAGRASDVAPRSSGGSGGSESHGVGEMPAAEPVGLSLSGGGLVLDPLTRTLTPGAGSDLRFRVLDADGSPVRSFDLEHQRRMHVIVVRRDLSGFQHLHPTMAADGTWTVPLRVSAPGAAVPRMPPAPSTAAVVDGYRVTLHRDGAAPGPVAFTFRIERGGRLVTPGHYLGALGHLVVLREGDLAFVHAHPDEDAAGPDVTFSSELPSSGRYRLFLQFVHGGSVHTAPFTVEVRP